MFPAQLSTPYALCLKCFATVSCLDRHWLRWIFHCHHSRRYRGEFRHHRRPHPERAEGWLRRLREFAADRELTELRAQDLEQWQKQLRWTPGSHGALYSENTVNKSDFQMLAQMGVGLVRLHPAAGQNSAVSGYAKLTDPEESRASATERRRIPFQLFHRSVRVDLSRREPCMASYLLDRCQGSATGHETR